MIKVSVIIPAYNLQNYIEKSLNSAINQSLQEIEILVINDGSKDSTLDIINNIASKCDRVRVIDKKNQGVSKARNTGIKEARGEYILFLDGDDWLHIDALKLLYNKAKEDDLDMVAYNFILAYENGVLINSNDMDFGNISGEEYLGLAMESKVSVALWSKLIRRDLFESYNIQCPEDIAFGEDMATTMMLSIYAKRVGKLNKNLYYYLQRSTSVTKTASTKILDVEKAVTIVEGVILENNKYDTLKDQYKLMRFLHLYYFNVVTSNILGEAHKTLYNIWNNYKDEEVYNNKFYKEFISKASSNSRMRLRLYNISYGLGSSYVTIINKVKAFRR